MLPPIEADESLIARGHYQQYRDNKSTEVHEHWSVHSLPDNALIWRSQVFFNDIRLSACYLLRDPDHVPVQMVFIWRWQDGAEDMVEYSFMPRYATVIYENQTQDVILPAGCKLYCWHTITEDFIWLGYDYAKGGAQSFRVLKPGIQHGTLLPSISTLEAKLEQSEIIPGPKGPTRTYHFSISEPEVGSQTLHFDDFGVPIRWELPAEKLSVALKTYERGTK